MEIIIIILLIFNLILGVISLFKNINESNITERLGRLEVTMTKEMGEFKNDLSDCYEVVSNISEERNDTTFFDINKGFL